MRKEIYKTNTATVDVYGKLSIRMGDKKAIELLKLLGMYRQENGLAALYETQVEGDVQIEVTVAIVSV